MKKDTLEHLKYQQKILQKQTNRLSLLYSSLPIHLLGLGWLYQFLRYNFGFLSQEKKEVCFPICAISKEKIKL